MPPSTAMHELVIDHSAAWGKWPNTVDTDFSAVLNASTACTYRLDNGQELTVTTHYYPAYCAYAQAGCLKLPDGLPAGLIDTRKPPAQIVLQQQLAAIREYAKTCKVIRWRHGYQCHTEVSSKLPELFPLRILEFGDDAPGSSEHKSFPHAGFFNALIHNMYICNASTGARTAGEYRRRGVRYTRFAMLPHSSGIYEYIRDSKFDVRTKANRVAAGEMLPLGLVFVGCRGFTNNVRVQFLQELAAHRADLHTAGLVTIIHVPDLAEGILLPRDHPLGDGVVLGPLYADSLFGVNIGVSSIFNCRLQDQAMLGMAQLIYDPHNELADFGLLPDIHYIPFDGTAADCKLKMLSWSNRRAELASIVVAGSARLAALREEFSHYNAYRDVYQKFLNGDIE